MQVYQLISNEIFSTEVIEHCFCFSPYAEQRMFRTFLKWPAVCRTYVLVIKFIMFSQIAQPRDSRIEGPNHRSPRWEWLPGCCTKCERSRVRKLWTKKIFFFSVRGEECWCETHAAFHFLKYINKNKKWIFCFVKYNVCILLHVNSMCLVFSRYSDHTSGLR